MFIFKGPNVIIKNPEIDLGLIRSDSIGFQTITLENTCDIEATILVRNFEDRDNLTLESIE